MKYKLMLISFLIFILSLGGCSNQSESETVESFDAEANVATWDQMDGSMSDMLSPMLIGDNLYYWSGNWDNNARRWSDSSIYKKKGGESEASSLTRGTLYLPM